MQQSKSKTTTMKHVRFTSQRSLLRQQAAEDAAAREKATPHGTQHSRHCEYSMPLGRELWAQARAKGMGLALLAV
eukprot:CAMPEP_0119359922 /NCGR_PEP_ID=MMETSP1334-20130426/7682_1 /TAXON_ID=127549 /ORGANISM="Calcidiscus leptoporus, Strain RCC1130" /LENGTH=74 /DNA_ID=CAMNT_0007374673 /DNA_START=356 /DNA_END=581 /DNA_ORIENTATION=+